MPTTISIRDETTTGESLREFMLEFLTEHITTRELIRSRVFQEVKDYNRSQSEVYRGLVRPTDAEETLNGYRLKKPRRLDWEKQFEKALEAFEATRIPCSSMTASSSCSRRRSRSLRRRRSRS